MARRSGLGRGLSSLIPPGDGGDSGDGGISGSVLRDVVVAEIVPNPNQPRRHFDDAALSELAASIQHLGVLQPVLVRPASNGYELIAGERRWRAAQRAGLATIPAVVRETEDLASVEQALVENLHREDLNPLEEAAAYQQLIEDFELTHEQVATRVGKSRSAISNTLRLLGLPPLVQRALGDGTLSAGHARALLGTPDRSLQERLANAAVAEGWSVRTMEDAVKSGDAASEADSENEPVLDGAGVAPSTRLRPPGLLELEELLAERLSTKVSVRMGAKRGKITIDFADLADLERIYRAMNAE